MNILSRTKRIVRNLSNLNVSRNFHNDYKVYYNDIQSEIYNRNRKNEQNEQILIESTLKPRFENKIAVITRCNTDISKETSFTLFENGLKGLICTDIDPMGGYDLVKNLKDYGYDATFITGDLSNFDFSNKVMEKAMTKYGKIDLLVNLFEKIHPFDNTIEYVNTNIWDETIKINMNSIINPIKSAIPQMKEKKSGAIINIIPYLENENKAAFSASRGAIIALTKDLAEEYDKNNIRINNICIGEFNNRSRNYSNELNIEPGDIANSILFLGGDDSTNINGLDLLLDGFMIYK